MDSRESRPLKVLVGYRDPEQPGTDVLAAVIPEGVLHRPHRHDGLEAALPRRSGVFEQRSGVRMRGDHLDLVRHA